MNLAELKKLRETTNVQAKQYTLEDLAATEAILPLPAGLHECKIIALPKDGKLTSFRMTVECDKKKYSVYINLGTTPESAQMARNNLDYLCQQLDIKKFDIKVLQEKIGEDILILGLERVTDAGTFVNYTFNTASMISYL